MRLKKKFCFHGATEICTYRFRMHIYSCSRCLPLKSICPELRLNKENVPVTCMLSCEEHSI